MSVKAYLLLVLDLAFFYGLPKVKKTVTKKTPQLRPIFSAINTLAYKLAKSLVPILSPLTSNDYTVKNAFSFVEEIANFDSSLFMASLDFKSLFTNFPSTETISNCIEDLYNDNLYSGSLNKVDLFNLLQLATLDFSFIFDNSFYKQTDIVTMSSPLGPTLPNGFLCHHEKHWLSAYPSHFKPVVYKRYVDNIFVSFRSNDHLPLFVNYMNKKHKNMKFTLETKTENCFSLVQLP